MKLYKLICLHCNKSFRVNRRVYKDNKEKEVITFCSKKCSKAFCEQEGLI